MTARTQFAALLDREVAAIYGVSTGRLNQAVKRNPERFPADFMFQLTAQELENLRSQFATSSWGGRRYRPFALERSLAALDAKTQRQFNSVYEAIRALMIPPLPRRRGIGK